MSKYKIKNFLLPSSEKVYLDPAFIVCEKQIAKDLDMSIEEVREHLETLRSRKIFEFDNEGYSNDE